MTAPFTIPPAAKIAVRYKHGMPHGSQFGLVVLAIAPGGLAGVEQTLGDRIRRWEASIVPGELARLVDALVTAGFPDAPHPAPRHPPGVLVPGTTFTTLEIGGDSRRSVSFPSHEGPRAYDPVFALLDEIVRQVTGGLLRYGVSGGPQLGSWVTGARELT